MLDELGGRDHLVRCAPGGGAARATHAESADQGDCIVFIAFGWLSTGSRATMSADERRRGRYEQSIGLERRESLSFVF